jgi:hypothetical protein
MVIRQIKRRSMPLRYRVRRPILVTSPQLVPVPVIPMDYCSSLVVIFSFVAAERKGY